MDLVLTIAYDDPTSASLGYEIPMLWHARVGRRRLHRSLRQVRLHTIPVLGDLFFGPRQFFVILGSFSFCKRRIFTSCYTCLTILDNSRLCRCCLQGILSFESIFSYVSSEFNRKNQINLFSDSAPKNLIKLICSDVEPK